jgi:CelD/BcsL family acetyltransferase involved in cellulose biosynthesis
LVKHSVEPNVFFEPWMFLPAVELFGAGAELLFVLTFHGRADQPPTQSMLTGFFPLTPMRRYKGLPVRGLTLWQHKYCSVSTPLVRAQYEEGAFNALLEWFATRPGGARLLEFTQVSADGQWYRHLHDALVGADRAFYCAGLVSRAAFRPAANVETYLQNALSGEYRRQMKRKEKRLAELGRIEYHTLDAEPDVDRWLDTFLTLEGSGWKGREGTALASTPEDREFFLRIGREGFRRQRLIFQSMELDGKPIAQYVAFSAGTGSFDFKPAYDESYGRYSPGILLELERFRYLHTRTDLTWMDSCSTRDSFRNSLWGERKVLLGILISQGSLFSDLIVAVIPLLKWVRTVATVVRSGGRRAVKPAGENLAAAGN